jgi:opacity protein-like surface antigen
MVRPLMRLAVVASTALAFAVSAVPSASSVAAADNCQHFSHTHYHFPYAHRDNYDNTGQAWYSNGEHWHEYHNTTHDDWFWKACPNH